MKFALVNPHWSYEGSAYFGCRAPHLPLELGYSEAILREAGHEVFLLDALLEDLGIEEVRRRVTAFAPDFTVIPTAPSYLFWRCPPPELDVPKRLATALQQAGGFLVVVGPHASTTPRACLQKLDADVAIMGECEQVLPRLTEDWQKLYGIAWRRGEDVVVQGRPQMANVRELPPLGWPRELLARHTHHHHRFDGMYEGLGAELEASRGCPYNCSFCAKTDHRDGYRRRSVKTVLAELDDLISKGVGYVYFIDEIFLPDDALLRGLAERAIRFGMQTRIDLWNPERLDALAAAGCVSIEAGVESVSPNGCDALNKRCRLRPDGIEERLIYARARIPYVEATLLASEYDDADALERWRARMQRQGVSVNGPLPLFPYPGSPEYLRRFGFPDDEAWERALDHYLTHSSVGERAPPGAPSVRWGAEASSG